MKVIFNDVIPFLAIDVPTPQAIPWATIEPNPPIIPPDC